MTKVQKAILEAVRQSGAHLSADDVFHTVRHQYPSVALGTVYRNLNHFADERLIRRVTRPDAAGCYEGNVAPHDHCVCVRCGRIADLKVEGLKDFLKAGTGCDIVSFDLTVNYVCLRCAGEKV